MAFCNICEQTVDKVVDHLYYWGSELFGEFDYFYIPQEVTNSNACADCWNLIKDDMKPYYEEADSYRIGASIALWACWKSGMSKGELEDISHGFLMKWFAQDLLDSARAVRKQRMNSV